MGKAKEVQGVTFRGFAGQLGFFWREYKPPAAPIRRRERRRTGYKIEGVVEEEKERF